MRGLKQKNPFPQMQCPLQPFLNKIIEGSTSLVYDVEHGQVSRDCTVIADKKVKSYESRQYVCHVLEDRTEMDTGNG
jgi:hypothetical protein